MWFDRFREVVSMSKSILFLFQFTIKYQYSIRVFIRFFPISHNHLKQTRQIRCLICIHIRIDSEYTSNQRVEHVFINSVSYSIRSTICRNNSCYCCTNTQSKKTQFCWRFGRWRFWEWFHIRNIKYYLLNVNVTIKPSSSSISFSFVIRHPACR